MVVAYHREVFPTLVYCTIVEIGPQKQLDGHKKIAVCSERKRDALKIYITATNVVFLFHIKL